MAARSEIICNFANHNVVLNVVNMKPYKQKKEKVKEVSEPEAVYGIAQQSKIMPMVNGRDVPEGYMTLEEFGELFHKKLDDCYAKLQSDN